ncbi:MAG: hypothetical protein MUF44_04300 [Hydrogenophaga sp.]|jgi:phage terminase Nu1 subunit (DNA packaging protein)|nr:hypothetical protein [Hydrogenophaga sp.]
MVNKVVMYLDRACTQQEFGDLVGISQQAVSRLQTEGMVREGASLGTWLLDYCDRLREQAAGRMGSDMEGLDLVQERAALARSQREAQDLKNAVARSEYAPIGVLADVLGHASSAVVDRLDQIEGGLRKACPGIEDDVLSTVMSFVSSARNEWMRSTARLVDEALESYTGEDDAPDHKPTNNPAI